MENKDIDKIRLWAVEYVEYNEKKVNDLKKIYISHCDIVVFEAQIDIVKRVIRQIDHIKSLSSI